MILMTEAGIMAEADARVFGLLMASNRTARRMMAADRTIAGAYARVATLRQRQEAKASRDHARADRELARELEPSIAPGWGRTFVVRMPPSPPVTSQPASATIRAAARASTATRAIRAYTAPLRDNRGRVALYLNIKYRGLKSKGWRPGLSADHIGYILRELALEMAEAQLGRPISNMGETAEEIMACWRALEEVEAGYRANAKVQYRIVWNLPHELDADQRRALVEEFCERTFGRLGLPYVAAIHEPDASGDRRNYHAHICFSTRPCERTGDHEWAIAEEKVNGLTDKPGLRLVRALAAARMNRACRAAGSTTLFTHQTYDERGIDAERQAHVGPEAMAAHDRGEVVGVIARNAAIVERNELAVERQQVERQLDTTQHLQRLLAQADGMAERRSAVRAGRDAMEVFLRKAKGIARYVVRPARLGNNIGVRALELRARAVRIQRRLPVSGRIDLAIKPVARMLQLVPQLGRRASARRDRPASAVLATISQLTGRARAIGVASAAASARSNQTTSVCTDTTVKLSQLGKTVVATLSECDTTRISASHARADLRAIETRLAERRAAEQQRQRVEADALDRQARAKTVIMNATVPPYTLSAGRAAPNFTTLSAADRTLVRDLDRDTLVATLRLRIQRDLDEQAAARQREREQRAQEEHAEAERRAVQVRHDLAQVTARHEQIRAEPDEAVLGTNPVHISGTASVASGNIAERAHMDISATDTAHLARQRRLAWAADYRETLMTGWNDSRRRDRVAVIAVEPACSEPAVMTPPRQIMPPGFNPDERSR
ncbi:MobA/MobL family protein [uncultured Sphingomonas sp.]|uniref:MobA/MobL family protein n=1 Tax=uncultured Sphingomonas sp. TaxID=158754 RepID=UPI0035C9C11D